MPTRRRKPRQARLKSFPSPTGGWIANRNLAQPNAPDAPPGAAVLENWFPTATGALMRRGSEIYATLGEGDNPVTALFSYKNGTVEQLFGATQSGIWDITSIVSALNYSLVDEDEDVLGDHSGNIFGFNSTEGLDVVTGQTGGDWVVVQFATSGGVFLVMVNGTDLMQLYDGTTWFPINGEDIFTLDYDNESGAFTAGETLTGGTSGATATIVKVIDNGTDGTLWIGDVTSGPFQNDEAITDGDTGAADADGTTTQIAAAITGVDTDDLNFVWVFKNRLFFVEKDSLSAWYLSVDAIAGAATEFPMGGVFTRGGSLLFGQSWSLDSGSGLADHCVFVTTEGEVAVYQGSDPGDADAWALVGVYRIGKPLGKSAFIRAGGDLVIATDIGFVPLSQAIRRDYAALSPSAVSFSIEEAWNEAAELRNSSAWQCEVWPTAQMVIVALPTVNEQPPTWFVANARTGAWAKYTNWNATCLEIFQGRCFFGSTDGRVVEANVTGEDEGETFTGVYVPLFDDLRTPGSRKIAEMVQAVIRAPNPITGKAFMQFDFNIDLPSAPDAPYIPGESAWGSGVWGTSVWGVSSTPTTQKKWQSVGGSGEALAPGYQLTSGSTVPLDAEIVRLDLTYELADIVT